MAVGDVLRSLRSGERTFSREVVETLLTNLIVQASGVVTGILVARLLGPAGRGELAAIKALPTILGAVGMFGLHDAIIYFGSRERERAGAFAISSTWLILVLSLPVVVGGAVAMPAYLGEYSADVVRASRVYLLILYVNALVGIGTSIARALHDIRLWNILRLIGPGLWLACVAVFALLGIASPGRLASVYIVLFTAGATAAVFVVRRHLDGWLRPGVELWRRLLGYGLPSVAGTLPQLVGQQLDQLLIAGMFPPRELGLYAVAASWSLMVRLPGTAIAGVAFSRIAAMPSPRAQRAFIARIVAATTAVTLLLGVVLALSAPLLVPLLFTPEFRESVPLALILIGASAARIISLMLQRCLRGVGLPQGAMYAEWAGLATMFVGLALLVPRFGIYGAAWAAVGFGVVSLAVAIVVVRRWTRSVR